MFSFAHLRGMMNGCKAVRPPKNIYIERDLLITGRHILNNGGKCEMGCLNNVPGAAVYSPFTSVMIHPRSWSESTQY